MPKSSIAESYGKPIFSFERNCQTVFQSVCTILHSRWDYVSPPSFSASLSAFGVNTVYRQSGMGILTQLSF